MCIDSRLDPRVLDRIKGAAWENIREQILIVSHLLLNVNPAVTSELTTIYVKFKNPSGLPYAVLWIKNSKSIVVGLSINESDYDERLEEAPKGMRYPNLTGYVSIDRGNPVPVWLQEFAIKAFDHSMTLIGL